MRELLERRNVDVDRTIAGGESVELGGLRNFLNRHATDKPVSVRVDFNVDSEDIPRLGNLTVLEESDTDLRKDIAENGLTDIERAWIKVACRWDAETKKAWITAYEVGINDRRIAEISAKPGYPACVTFVDFEHPLFTNLDKKEGISQQDDHGTRRELDDLCKEITVVADSTSPMEGLELHPPELATVIPSFTTPLPLTDSSVGADDQATFELLSFLLNIILVGTGAVLLRQLQGIRYLGPIRDIPPRNFVPQRSPEEARWANGLAAWDVLYAHYDQDARAGDDLFKSVSRLMSAGDELSLGYSMELAEVYEVRDDSVIMSHLRTIQSGQASDAGELFRAPLLHELDDLRPERRLILHDEVNDTDVKPQDIGAGISQVLPVVVGAVEPKCFLFAVEEPELHIHPRVQCSLGDVFAREAGKNDGRIFLIETHSEHLILRLLRRIRETTENELPPGKPELRPNQVAVYYVEGGEQGIKLTDLPMTPDGDFARQWPQGFFEEREEELF